ncbi:hypothetical protein SPRG_19401 [Saprolegnia parasitica CBS 223.65]|uniref:Thioredoxin domain-containing protein n=1 Tax=Saprolegnia parasitica (strain CBS 223.65) TaxID=695850 RepID=A0A067D2T3_SAPPC|nr:hypothetical protein SPRG_19401 [Saprolegnia parasitica CBS 223.65]KDO33337.1 hypothetical protein SPRG_19401 [Saprolegnia parasitica CBS 223.65]|eukprot:XP_012196279.1 hypothetical protein SPRG_19401 [Saprolegnia parasitica CBS 223.65]
MNKVSTALLAVFVALISLVLADDAGSSNVVQLTGDNFQELTQLETDNADVHIAKVDATDDVELKLRFQVNGYPTVLFVKDNKMYAYDGARTLEALSAFATGGYAEQEAKDIPTSPLVDLTDDTFDAVTRVNEPNADAWLVQFHAHWCGHCKDMMGAMLQTALTLQDHGNVHVARVDADINAKLGMRFAITGYPTLVLIRDGRVYEFDGLRDPKLMTAFALTDYATKDSRPLPHPMEGKPATKKAEVFQTLSLTISELGLETIAAVLALGGGLGYTFAVMRSPKKLPKGLKPLQAKKNE